MGKIQKATRLPPDDAERLEEYAEERDISEADALRRLIHDRLDEVEGAETATRRHNMIPGNKPLLAVVTLDALMTGAILMGGP